MAAKAKTKVQASSSYKAKTRVKRPGVHAKTKQSNNKGAQNYVKPNVGQGK